MEPLYSVYILRCADGSLYTGVAADVEKRLAAHAAGRGARYTRGRGPLTLVYRESIGTRAEAQRKEYALKQLSHAQKEAVIAAFAACPEAAPPDDLETQDRPV